MSLPHDSVYSQLQSDFVVGWKNIKNKSYVGRSHGYTPRQCSLGTTNGAGGKNLQIFVLSPDLTVLHALPGFWHPEDLARELRFARSLLRLWQDENRTRAQKNSMHRLLQLAEARYQPEATSARSGWQSFDQRNEPSRLRRGSRDTFRTTKDGYLLADRKGQLLMKPTNVLVHERMARRPFVRFEDFDVAEFADYGNTFYDKNMRFEKKRKTFPRPRPKKKKRQRRK